MVDLTTKLDGLSRHNLAHLPTPIDAMPNLGKLLGSVQLFAKRDDCTGLAMGGNKARQLEFYLGDALAKNADTILITGAVQSNFIRMAAAAARKAGLDCHLQMEERVPNASVAYRTSGNVLLNKMLGADLHSFPVGEDEKAADENLEKIAGDLREAGKNPYVIHLGPGHPPLGALGYVVAAREIVDQSGQYKFDEVFVPSGSGATHAGLLFGLRALGCDIPVRGICVRRGKQDQHQRIANACVKIAGLLETENPVKERDINLDDSVLAPGYGQMNDAVREALQLSATSEGLLLDPVYSGRTMAGLIKHVRRVKNASKILFIHTGGQPAIFGYQEVLGF